MAFAIFWTGSMSAQEDSLATYIAAAIRNTPELMAQYSSYKAQVSAACGEGILEDPTLQIGFFPSAMQHVNGKQIATFTLMQMFPWFGTLKAGRESMLYNAESAYQKFRADGISLAYNVQEQWYGILATQEKIKAVEGKAELLENLRELSMVSYRNGGGARMSDQLRLEAEAEQLKEQGESFSDQMRLQCQQFNLLMHRDADSPLSIPDSIILREMPEITWEEIERNDPLLKKATAEGKAAEARGKAASGKGMPTISLRVEYMLNGKVDMPRMQDMNGDDMFMPMVSISLPIYRRRTNMEKASARFSKESSEYAYRSRQDDLKGEYLSLGQKADELRRKIALYDKEVSLLDRTLALMNSEYASGATSLSDILQTTRQYIDYALKKAEAYAEYNTLMAGYEKLASQHDYAERLAQ